MLNQCADDDVVEEIPVFLSKNLQENLYLFQYPTKTQISNFDNSAVVNCCVKPLNQEVKVDFALNTESHFYDRFKGEQFALASDGKCQMKGERPTYKRGIMDKQSFTSTCSVDDVDRYVVGIISDKELHLTPLASILQLRPSLSHFDKEDKRIKAEQKALNDEDDEEELQQVTVKFAKTGVGNKKTKTKEKQGYANFVKRSNEESWCETYWHPRKSPTAELERQKLFATNQQINLALELDSHKYVKKLLPDDGKDQGIDAVLPPTVISKARLKSMPLVDQLKVILKDVRMMSFEDICSILQECSDSSVPSEKVLRALPQVGVLIHGNWVPQSDIIYPADTLSNSNGVSSELMIRARDYVLFRFSRVKYLYRRQVISATQLPPDEAAEVLHSVARLNSEKKWELLVTPNKEFEQRYPELVQRQEMVWRATEQTYNEMDFEKSPKRSRKRSIRELKLQPSQSSQGEFS
ncbi:DNA-directed RNA polymerase III subunit RPC5 [Anastrepha obliqua]|uniref:DNA-directed RNA polymerase III subunit RPC5 n=1 Tax=Anastrepha obliqua TaxID=95512 RepID=UPI002409E8B3|nr:DNA-directed RNA polymerase III subunit RPC5 [Anastrepha obliqua]